MCNWLAAVVLNACTHIGVKRKFEVRNLLQKSPFCLQHLPAARITHIVPIPTIVLGSGQDAPHSYSLNGPNYLAAARENLDMPTDIFAHSDSFRRRPLGI